MPHTNAWDETSPAGTDLISTGDNAIRQFKLDVRERMELDHVWDASLDHDGKHLRVRLRPDADVTPIATDSANSLTGSTAGGLVDLAQTWNTSGICRAVKVNVTDTGSHATSMLMDLQKAGTSQFKVDKSGAVTFLGTLTLGSGAVQLTDSTGKIQAISSTYFASLSGANLTSLNASNLSSGTVPLARLVDITNTEIAAAAAIAWTKISKTGSSLGDLTTRSASDLSSGTLAAARLPATAAQTDVSNTFGAATTQRFEGVVQMVGSNAITGATSITGLATIEGNGSRVVFTAAAVTVGTIGEANGGMFLQFVEGSTDVAAPAANRGTLYLRDSGGGKSQLVIRFNTGAVQVIATEP